MRVQVGEDLVMHENCDHTFDGPGAHAHMDWTRGVPHGDPSPRCSKCGMSKAMADFLRSRDGDR